MSAFLPPTSAVMSEDELNACFTRLKNPDTHPGTKTKLRNQIFRAFMRYAYKLALQVFKDDSLQTSAEAGSIAYDALYEAIDHFDPQRGIRFTTYSAKVIQRALRAVRRRLLATHGREVSIEGNWTMPINPEYAPAVPPELIYTPWPAIDHATTCRDAVEFLLSLRLKDHQRCLILDYLETNGNLAAIGRKWGMTRQRVQQVWAKLREDILKQCEGRYALDIDSLPIL